PRTWIATCRRPRCSGAFTEDSRPKRRWCRSSPYGFSLDAGQVGVTLELLEVVDGLDATDGAGARPHHQRLGRGAVREVVHAFDELAIGHAGERKEHVVAADQVVDAQHAIEPQTKLLGLDALVVVA